MTTKPWVLNAYVEMSENLRKMVGSLANKEQEGYTKGKLTDIALDMAGVRAKFEAILKEANDRDMASDAAKATI